jgi:MinD-like ATPase involved in chromosome partitioning or flagellar assembly
MPAIVSFYSFKGGVGRTTLLAAVARLLAASGKRVVLLDLDLEAPGLGAFLEVDTERGAIDFIVDYLVTGVPDLQRCHGAASALGDELGAYVEVIPAGRMSWAYVEKLGRLDFSDVGFGTESSVTRAVRALVDAVRTEFAPDYILIDSRAGLHDIGGLSLHALAHVDVLVARATSQNLVGLEIALQTLGRRKRTDDLRRLLVAHTFAPRREDRETRTSEEEAFLQQVYALFSKWIYMRSNLPDQLEQRDSDDAPHFPRSITQHADLERINAISAAPPAVLDGEDFRRLCDRLVELCEPEDTAEEDDEPPTRSPVLLEPPDGDAS